MHRSILLLPVLLLACNGSSGDDTSTDTFALTMSIPASYATFHTGNDFSLAIVDADDPSAPLQSDTGVIGTDSDFTFDLNGGDNFSLAFWIDANLGGGTAGVCDFDSGTPEDSPDHQWLYSIGAVDADREFTIPAHNTTFTDVCSTFE